MMYCHLEGNSIQKGILWKVRPVGTKLILGGLKRGASEASQNGGPGACPRENFS